MIPRNKASVTMYLLGLHSLDLFFKKRMRIIVYEAFEYM